MFLNHLPLEACSRIWDVFLLEGDAFLFRAALAVLACIESRLFFPDRKELLEVLKGESKAALEVARRDAVSPLQSEHGDILGPRYDVYHVDEETVWERVMEMAEWWKEGTWHRLILRELPDL
jgi:TBC1 domain family member 14